MMLSFSSSASGPPSIGAGTGNPASTSNQHTYSVASPTAPHLRSSQSPTRRYRQPNAFLLFRSCLYSSGVLPESTHQSSLSITAAALWRGMSTEEKAPWFAAAAKRAKEERERRVGLGEGGQVELIWVEREARERKKRTRRRVVKNTFKDVDTHTDSDAISESGVTVANSDSSSLRSSAAPPTPDFLQLDLLSDRMDVNSAPADATTSVATSVPSPSPSSPFIDPSLNCYHFKYTANPDDEGISQRVLHSGSTFVEMAEFVYGYGSMPSEKASYV